MGLTEEERDRLADVVRLQPTKNAELGDRWGVESGSDVHAYLEEHLSDYYYRDDDSLIRATDEAAALVDVEPGVESADGDRDGAEGDVPDVVRVPEIEARTFAVVAGPDERAESVVSVLHKLRAEYGIDPEAGDVRRALQSLRRKGVVAVERRTVPTFRRAEGTGDVRVEVVDV
jgi:hypothetical protein